jgi:hypothetical protein
MVTGCGKRVFVDNSESTYVRIDDSGAVREFEINSTHRKGENAVWWNTWCGKKDTASATNTRYHASCARREGLIW